MNGLVETELRSSLKCGKRVVSADALTLELVRPRRGLPKIKKNTSFIKLYI